MVSKILIRITQMDFVVNHLFTRNQSKKVMREMMNLVIFILVILKWEIEKLEKEYGHVVKVKLEKQPHVLKIDISLLNGLMKKPKSITMIGQ